MHLAVHIRGDGRLHDGKKGTVALSDPTVSFQLVDKILMRGIARWRDGQAQINYELDKREDTSAPMEEEFMERV